MAYVTATDSLLGRGELSFGTCNIYWDTGTGGENIDLGGFDSAKINIVTTKIDLMESQAGARPADKAVSSQLVTVTLGMSRATLARLNAVIQGIYVQYDTSDIAKRLWLPKLTGQLDTTIAKQLTIKEIIDGEETSEPFGILDLWKCAPSTESAELNYDATSQRFFPTAFLAYESNAAEHLDPQGRSSYGATRDTGE